jgi:hypothetical protein
MSIFVAKEEIGWLDEREYAISFIQYPLCCRDR